MNGEMISSGSFLAGVFSTLFLLAIGALAYHAMREAVKAESK
jgi:hypothetical protein